MRIRAHLDAYPCDTFMLSMPFQFLYNNMQPATIPYNYLDIFSKEIVSGILKIVTAAATIELKKFYKC